MKCICRDKDCRSEILFDRHIMLIRMNKAASLEGSEPEFLFYLDANSATELIKELRAWLLRQTEGD